MSEPSAFDKWWNSEPRYVEQLKALSLVRKAFEHGQAEGFVAGFEAGKKAEQQAAIKAIIAICSDEDMKND